MLQATAKRLTSLVRQPDHAGWIGGDECPMILVGMHNLDEATRRADLFLRRAARTMDAATTTRRLRLATRQVSLLQLATQGQAN